MKPTDLINSLAEHLESDLANDLINEFVQIRSDCKTATLGGSAPGKFIESVVQVLQFLESGSYDTSPRVDVYLRGLESSTSNLNDDLRIACARIARSCYTLRNKRGIAHKGAIAPNLYDLNYIYSSALWIMSELVRQLLADDPDTASKMMEFIQIPISSVVESIGGRKIIHGDFTVDEELLVLLHSYYPIPVLAKEILASMDRCSRSSVYKSLKSLWQDKLLHKDTDGYVLTQEGYKKARSLLFKALEKDTA